MRPIISTINCPTSKITELAIKSIDGNWNLRNTKGNLDLITFKNIIRSKILPILEAYFMDDLINKQMSTLDFYIPLLKRFVDGIVVSVQ